MVTNRTKLTFIISVFGFVHYNSIGTRRYSGTISDTTQVATFSSNLQCNVLHFEKYNVVSSGIQKISKFQRALTLHLTLIQCSKCATLQATRLASLVNLCYITVIYAFYAFGYKAYISWYLGRRDIARGNCIN